MQGALGKCWGLASRGSLETLILTSIIASLLTSVKTSVDINRTFVISHSKAHFQLGPECIKRNSVSYCTILNTKRFDVALKCFYFTIMKSDHNVNLIVDIKLKAVSGNRAFKKVFFLFREEQYNNYVS